MVVIILFVIVLLAAMLIWLNKEMGALVREAVFCREGLFQILA
jgi:succinate dehydrogenase hydrophobic anchor subunit